MRDTRKEAQSERGGTKGRRTRKGTAGPGMDDLESHEALDLHALLVQVFIHGMQDEVNGVCIQDSLDDFLWPSYKE